MNFNWVDYVIIGILFLSTLAGLLRGFVREVLSLLTLIAAFVIATLFADDLAVKFTSSSTVQNAVNHASNAAGTGAAEPVSYVALAISFALLFAGTIILGAIISFFLNLAFRTGILGFGNRLLGGIFGLVRGFIINLVMIFIVQLTPFSNEVWWQESKLVAMYQPAVAWLGNIVSPSLANLKEKFGKTFDDMNTQIQRVTGSGSKKNNNDE